jgi:hypothetical protein
LVLTLAFGGGYRDDELVRANWALTLAVTMAIGGGYTGSGSGATITDVGILSVNGTTDIDVASTLETGTPSTL